MNKAIKILTFVLVLQVLLVVLTHLDQLKNNDSSHNNTLLAFDWSKIDGLRISTSESASVLLKKKSEHEWFLPDYHNLPVDSTKIDELLTKFKAIKTEWPVATTSEATKRFEVSKDHFQRQIAFLQGDTAQSTLITGTSPGYRKVHAKLDDQNAIYAIELSNFLASAVNDDWLKKQLFALDLNQVKSMSIADIQLTKPDQEWLLAGLAAEQKINHKSLQNLLDALSNFRVESAFGPSVDASELENTVATLELEVGSEKQTWVFYEPKEGAHFILKSTQNPVYFKVNRAEAEKLTQLQRNQLIEPKVIEPKVIEPEVEASTTPSTSMDPGIEPAPELIPALPTQ
jgi:hypothetical protein